MADMARHRMVLGDTEASLRQVDSVLTELDSEMGSDPELRQERAGGATTIQGGMRSLSELVATLHGVYGEIMGIIGSLRDSRNLLEQAAMERLKRTHEKLHEVTSATEMAATGMLDGLDRSLVLLDRLEETDDEAGAEVRDSLREELHGLISLLQFQDITAQQLGYASGVLSDIEDRLVRIARVFDLDGSFEETPEPEVQTDVFEAAGADASAETCDPDASHFEADSRQALADEIFGPVGTPDGGP
jgi:chemotaxis regulatin CheY-phosphate phosphatase CheZ